MERGLERLIGSPGVGGARRLVGSRVWGWKVLQSRGGARKHAVQKLGRHGG